MFSEDGTNTHNIKTAKDKKYAPSDRKCSIIDTNWVFNATNIGLLGPGFI